MLAKISQCLIIEHIKWHQENLVRKPQTVSVSNRLHFCVYSSKRKSGEQFLFFKDWKSPVGLRHYAMLWFRGRTPLFIVCFNGEVVITIKDCCCKCCQKEEIGWIRSNTYAWTRSHYAGMKWTLNIKYVYCISVHI